MTDHPYWSYGPDSGQPIVDALDEGRRLAALTLALQGNYWPPTEEALDRARMFEAYLKGDADGTPDGQ